MGLVYQLKTAAEQPCIPDADIAPFSRAQLDYAADWLAEALMHSLFAGREDRAAAVRKFVLESLVVHAAGLENRVSPRLPFPHVLENMFKDMIERRTEGGAVTLVVAPDASITSPGYRMPPGFEGHALHLGAEGWIVRCDMVGGPRFSSLNHRLLYQDPDARPGFALASPHLLRNLPPAILSAYVRRAFITEKGQDICQIDACRDFATVTDPSVVVRDVGPHRVYKAPCDLIYARGDGFATIRAGTHFLGENGKIAPLSELDRVIPVREYAQSRQSPAPFARTRLTVV